MKSLALVGLCLALSSCASTPTTETAFDVDATRKWLREFGTQYSYDTGYMEQLLDDSPAAYQTFAAAMAMAEHRVHLPVDAHFVACISALMADDCGACAQLNLRMAVEAGVDRSILRSLIEDPARLPPLLRLVNEHATQVARGQNADPERVAKLKSMLGAEAFGELAVNVLGSRIYPALRRAMGAEKDCPPLTLDF